MILELADIRILPGRSAEFDEAIGSPFVVSVIVVRVRVIGFAHAVPVSTIDTAGIAAHEITDLVLVDQALQGVIHGDLLCKLSRLVQRIERGDRPFEAIGHSRRMRGLNGSPPHQRNLAGARPGLPSR